MTPEQAAQAIERLVKAAEDHLYGPDTDTRIELRAALAQVKGDPL